MIRVCACAGEPVDGGLGQQRVGGHGEPLGRVAVARHRWWRGLGVPFDDEFVEVGGGGGVQRPECEVVDDEQVEAGQPAELGFQGVGPAGRRGAG